MANKMIELPKEFFDGSTFVFNPFEESETSCCIIDLKEAGLTPMEQRDFASA